MCPGRAQVAIIGARHALDGERADTRADVAFLEVSVVEGANCL